MTLFADWSYPNSIRFGAGRIREIGEVCALAKIAKPLLITDANLAKLPITLQTLDLLEEAGLKRGIFSEVDPNPNEKNLQAGIQAFLKGGHDGVIAFGGGSGLDLGKAVAFMAKQTRPVWDFEDIDDWWKRADPDVIFPNIAVPTTAGTGSEVGRASVITDSQTHTKKIIFHPKILPVTSILDPELTTGMPRSITVGTGMDAFVHCLEAYCSPNFHPMSQGIALEGMKLIRENLPLVYENPNDIEARGKVLAAASMGAVAFQKGLGATHALAHQIGALYGTHHGMTNAVIVPWVLEMNRPAIETKIEDVCRYLLIPGGFDGFIEFWKKMKSDLQVPEKLSAMGVDKTKIEQMTQMALKDPSASGNPVRMTPENTVRLFESCI